MERRIFLAIILAAVVMYGWQAFFMPPPPPSRSTAPAQQGAPGAAQSASTPAATPAPSSAVPAEAQPIAAPSATVKGEPTEREIVVDTAVARVVLTNRGGRVLHWQLKEYRSPAGELVDLIPSNSPADQPRPFSLRVDDAQVTQRLNE